MRQTIKPTALPPLTACDIERFCSYFVEEPNSGCSLWIGGADKHGYGRFSLKTENGWRTFLAHRISWSIYKGNPGRFFVLHHCDFPPCINPDHLFLGDQTANMADCARKGRAIGNRGLVVGEKHGLHKLTWSIVDEIRASDLLHAELAQKFGVHKSLISLVQRRKIWKEKTRYA